MAEGYFFRLRRAEIGTCHHVAGPYLLQYAQASLWCEDNRKVSNGYQVNRILPRSPKSAARARTSSQRHSVDQESSDPLSQADDLEIATVEEMTMSPTELPRHIVDRFERRWAKKLEQEARAWKTGKSESRSLTNQGIPVIRRVQRSRPPQKSS